MESKDLISVFVKDELAYVTIERQEKLNALNKNILEILTATFIKLDQDNGVRIIVLSGAGNKAFAAGADLGEIMVLNSQKEMEEYYNRFETLYRTIQNISKPVIASVNGIAFGGGCLLALACDLVIATPNSKFSQPEINFGFIGGVSFLSRMVGKHIASEITMLGLPFSASEAYRIGLVNRIVEKDVLESEIDKLCSILKSKSPIALSMIKKCINKSYNGGLEESVRFETDSAASCLMTKDSRDSIASFVNSKK